MLNIRGTPPIPTLILSCTLSGLVLTSGAARAEPPIRSPEDAACRLEARAKVFSTPNPHGLELEELRRQIYYACMTRTGAAAAQPAKRPGRRHRRHRRH